MAKTRVLICHEWAVAREGMRTQLESAEELDVVDTTDAGMSAVIAAMSDAVDVVVTGLRLNGFGGRELVRRLHDEVRGSQVKVVMVLPDDDPAVIEDALHQSPDGLILQECSSEEFRFAVQGVAEGRVVLGGVVANLLVGRFGSARATARSYDVDDPGMTSSLTARETEVLELVAEGRSTEEVARHLTITVTTVRTHLFRLRTKIGVRDRAGLVNFAFRSGVVQVA